MRTFTLARLAVAIVVAAAGVAATTVALVPRAIEVVTAHDSTGSVPDLDTLSQRSFVYAADGSVLTVLKAEENREPIALERVPHTVIDAILAVEDADFYDHTGINARSLIRALLANVSAGGIAQGGSTITQQVIKNAILTPKRDADRKIKEAMYAIRLERKLTEEHGGDKKAAKDEILERYLNTAYFGNSAYGVQAAAETYFGKQVEQVTIGEAALLAGLIRNPVGYDPFRFPERARIRRSVALSRLVEIGRLTQGQVDRLELAPLPEKKQSIDEAPTKEDYFAEEVKQLLLDDPLLGDTPSERYNAVFRGGLKVYTTLNPGMQLSALVARDEILTGFDPQFTAAIVAVEPTTGAVRAMVGGPGFENFKFNLATQGLRQPGSAFKTFVLTAAIEAGARPDDLIDGNSPCVFPNPPLEPYEVRAASGGVSPLSSMIAKSINCAFVRLGLIVGLDRVVDVAERLGITSELEPFPSISLGSEEVSPLDMASAYGVLGNNGIRQEPYFIERIEAPNGDVLFEKEHGPGEQVIDAGVAQTVTQMLQGVVSGGTATRAQLPGRQVAGKTGTAQDSADAWFVGYTPQLSTAVWMGAPVGRVPMTDAAGREVFGGRYAAPMWQRFMDVALAGYPAESFVAPPPPAARAPGQLYLPGVECGFKPAPTTVPVDPDASIVDVPVTAAPSASLEVLSGTGSGGLPLVPLGQGWVVVPCGRLGEYATSTVPEESTSSIDESTTSVVVESTTTTLPGAESTFTFPTIRPPGVTLRPPTTATIVPPVPTTSGGAGTTCSPSGEFCG